MGIWWGVKLVNRGKRRFPLEKLHEFAALFLGVIGDGRP